MKVVHDHEGLTQSSPTKFAATELAKCPAIMNLKDQQIIMQ